MGHWFTLSLVALVGATFGEASITILSQKLEIFDKDLVQENLKVVEHEDGSIFLDGTVTTTKPIGDEYSTSLTFFKLPQNMKIFSMKKSTSEMMNSIYKDNLMETFHKCSNLPYFEDKWEPPFPANTYKYDKCTIPSHEKYAKAMASGQFKVVIEWTREEEKVGVMEVEVEIKK